MSYYDCHVSGKTIENQLKQIKVEMCTNTRMLRNLVRKPTFAAVRVFSPSLATVELYKDCVKLTKPIYVRFTVLEMAKLKMQRFYYKFLCTHLF